MVIYDLGVNYDSRKSFYGKARVEEQGHKVILWSYDTAVLSYDEEQGLLNISGIYSNTTLRHIKEFLKQWFNLDLNKNEIENIIKTHGVYLK